MRDLVQEWKHCLFEKSVSACMTKTYCTNSISLAETYGNIHDHYLCTMYTQCEVARLNDAHLNYLILRLKSARPPI